MRFGVVEQRLVLVGENSASDVERASDGRFSADPTAVFEEWPKLVEWAESTEPDEFALDTNQLQNPVPRPRQVFGVGTNYRRHVLEAGGKIPDAPLIFTKFPSCLTGPQGEIPLPSAKVDWEAELVVVIGLLAERVEEKDGWRHVAGLAVGQDISERVLQLTGPYAQFSLGKSFPGFGPLGPVLVTPDEFDDPDDLELGCSVDDQVMQHGRTSDLIFAVPELIARLSAVCPLLPGDVIFTGTPEGVGAFRSPPLFLRPGQTLTSWVQGIGELSNPVVAGPGYLKG